MRKRTTKKPYFLLDNVERLDDNLFNCLLGLAVRDATAPISGSHVPVPPHTLKARDAIDELYPPKPVYIHDVRLVTRAAHSRSASLKLETLITGAFGRERTRDQAIESRVARRITMRNAPDTIRALLRAPPRPASAPVPAAAPHGEEHPIKPAAEDDAASTSTSTAMATATAAATAATAASTGGWWWAWLARAFVVVKNYVLGLAGAVEARQLSEQLRVRAAYRKAVLSFLRAHGKIGIVVGFITFVDMARAENAKKLRTAHAGAGTGTHQTTGTPVELQAEAKRATGRDVGAQGTYEGEMLFACSYLPLTYHPKPKGMLAGPRAWLAASQDDVDFDDADVEIGDEAVWHLGDDPIEGNYAAPLGMGGAAEGDSDAESSGAEDDDGSDADSEAASAFVLLYPDDNAPQSTSTESDEEDDPASP